MRKPVILKSAILFAIILFIGQTSGQAMMKESDLMETYSPGAYFEEHDLDLYDSVVPLMFKFKKPEWIDQSDLRLPSNCPTDNFEDGSLCPIFHHVLKKIAVELEQVNDLSFSFPETDMKIKFECDKLSKHFLTERVQTTDLQNYITRLRKCSNEKWWESDLITDYSGQIQPVYDKMVNKFTNEYYEKLPEANRNRKASELNDKVALTGLLHMHFLSLVKLWRRGTRDCKRGFIPDALISEKNLRQGLNAMAKQLNSGTTNYTYTMPYDDSQITRYFNIPIADCVYTSDKFYVRVLVPVTKVRLSPARLVNIRSIPFFKSSEGTPQLCMVQGFAKGRLFNTGVEEIGTTGRFGSLSSEVVCDTANYKLCKIPDPFETYDDQATDCARMLIEYDNEPSNENDASIPVKCPLDCSVITRPEAMPFVVRAHDPFDTIYLVMDPEKPSGIDLECFNTIVNGTGPTTEDTYVVRIPPIKKGAVGIILSCNCRLPLPAHNILAGSDCPDTLLVFKVLAFQDASDNDTPAEGEGSNKPAPVVNPDDAA